MSWEEERTAAAHSGTEPGSAISHPGETDLATAMASHPSRDALKLFIRGELERGEVQAVVRHLLSGCPQCRQRARKLWSLGELRPADKYLLAEMRRRAKSSRAGRVSFGEEEIR
jgi:hypothetical protein